MWLSILQTVVWTLATIVGWGLLRAYKAGRWVQTQDNYGEAIAQLTKRLDDGSERYSRLASQVNTLPEKLRSDIVDEHIGPLREGLSRLRHEVNDAKQAVSTLKVLVDERAAQNQRDHTRYEQQLADKRPR